MILREKHIIVQTEESKYTFGTVFYICKMEKGLLCTVKSTISGLLNLKFYHFTSKGLKRMSKTTMIVVLENEE